MVVLGTGMGLTSAPATEAIMGVVPKAKAGAGSAINDAARRSDAEQSKHNTPSGIAFSRPLGMGPPHASHMP